MKSKQSARRGHAVLAAAFLALPFFTTPAVAAWDVTIVASGTSSGGAWSGDTWTASASGATVLASEIEAHLASGPTRVETGSGGSEHGDITVTGAINWTDTTLTLSAARDVDIEAALTGTGVAAISLEYGQGAPAAGNQGVYRIGVPVTLPSNPTDPYTIANFTTTRGYDGTPAPRAVPICAKTTRTGTIFPGCSFLNPMNARALTITYETVEVNVPPDAGTFVYLPIKTPDPAIPLFPVAIGVQSLSSGKFLFPSSQAQMSYFDASGNILPGTVDSTGAVTDINSTTLANDPSKTWDWGPVEDWGPIHNFFDTRYFDHGYYIKFQPNAGEMGRDYQALLMLVTDMVTDSYAVIDYVFNVLPPAPSVSNVGNIALDATAPASVDLTLTGTGQLSLSATSSNSTLLHDANISGTATCTAAGPCTLTLTPVAGQMGTTTVTVTLSDAYRQENAVSFTMSVTPQVPSVSGSDIHTLVSQPATAILTLAGSENLTLTATSDNSALLPDANITGLSGCTAAGTCSLTLTPVEGQMGTANVTLTIDDTYGQQAATTFAFNVRSTVTVTYSGNGSTGGSVPVDGTAYRANDSVTVFGTSDLTRTGYTFSGWNTQPDGSGTHYDAGDTFTINTGTTLYAEWKPVTTSVTLGGGAFSFGWLCALMLLVGGRRLCQNR